MGSEMCIRDRAYAPALSQIVIFVLMALVILIRPAGLFGREENA